MTPFSDATAHALHDGEKAQDVVRASGFHHHAGLPVVTSHTLMSPLPIETYRPVGENGPSSE